MSFLAETIEEPVTRFQSEHVYARQRISGTGVKGTRFVSEDNNAVVYLVSIRPVLKNLDEIEGVFFLKSKPVIFLASIYGGHLAAEMKLEVAVPQELHQHEQEILSLIKEGLRSYVEWYKIAFWS